MMMMMIRENNLRGRRKGVITMSAVVFRKKKVKKGREEGRGDGREGRREEEKKEQL